jgi:hypothetical protein
MVIVKAFCNEWAGEITVRLVKFMKIKGSTLLTGVLHKKVGPDFPGRNLPCPKGKRGEAARRIPHLSPRVDKDKGQSLFDKSKNKLLIESIGH